MSLSRDVYLSYFFAVLFGIRLALSDQRGQGFF